jgi:hypothetical protein
LMFVSFPFLLNHFFFNGERKLAELLVQYADFNEHDKENPLRFLELDYINVRKLPEERVTEQKYFYNPKVIEKEREENNLSNFV